MTRYEQGHGLRLYRFEDRAACETPNPAPDRTFVEGDIDKAEFLGQLTYQDAALYREVLAIKAGDRVETIRSAA